MRLAEIVGLDAGDVFLPDRLAAKPKRLWRRKRERGESLDTDAPPFANQSGRRISKRRVQLAWATWQRRAGFNRIRGFHALRHTAVTNGCRASRTPFLAQRFARHASPLTTMPRAHPSERETAGRVLGWPAKSPNAGPAGDQPPWATV